MAIQGFQAKQNAEGEDYNTAILPEDSYQCLIEKVELREGTKYMSAETEMQLLFYFRPLNVPEEYKDKLLFYQTTTSFFNGKSDKAKSNLKASKLYTLIKTIYKHYKPDVKVDDMEPEEITDEVINELEGKQIMAIVKINASNKNKVSDIMNIKEEIKTGSQEDKPKASPDEELDDLLNS